MTRQLLLVPTLALLLISCDMNVPDAADALPPPPEVSFTDDRLVEVAEGIEQDFNGGDGEYFNRMFAPVAFFQRVVWPRHPSGKETEDFIKGFMERGEESGASFGGGIVRQFQAAGGVKFLRVIKDKEGVRLLYRVIGQDYAVSYLELLIGENEKGEPAVVDIYTASTGENLSRTTARMVPNTGTPGLAKLLGKGGDDTKQSLEAFGRMTELLRANKYEDALNYFDNLPEQLQRRKALQLVRIQAGMGTKDDKRYAAIINEFFDLYPNEPGVDLLQIDYYFLRMEYDSTLAAIERLDKRFQDPYLNFQRAAVYLTKGEYERAGEYAEALIRRDSTIIEPYLVLVSIGLQKKDNVATAAALERIQRNGAGTITFETIETDTAYAYFRNSSQYKQLERKYR